MSTNIMNVFKPVELKKEGTSVSHVESLSYYTNKRTGAKIARAVLDDGRTLIKTVTKTGVVSDTITTIPEISSVEQRNQVIEDLYHKHTQVEIAEMLNISQATVSKTLRKK